MPDQTVPPSGSGTSQAPLADRVRQRVDRAAATLERREDAASSSERKPVDRSEPHTREARALKVVYRQLGKTHRQYRERTGKHVTPPLREAVQAFKQEPSLPSLVAVAGFLDELSLLSW